MNERKLIAIVDDDESVRESLPDFLKSFGFEVQAFASAEDFLASLGSTRIDCLILDLAMPGMTGPELQLELARREAGIPIVCITAGADEKAKRDVLRRGAVACLTKPFAERAIIEAVNAALAP